MTEHEHLGFRSSVASGWQTRTWKREIACMLLLIWSVVTIRIFCMPASDTWLGVILGLYSITTPAAFGFALAAFGLDSYVKQIRGGGQVSSTTLTESKEPATPLEPATQTSTTITSSSPLAASAALKESQGT